MRLGLNTGYAGATIKLPMDLIREADRLGYYAVWTAEAYGSDAVSPLAWIGAQTEQIHLGTAILQMPARSPAMTAMTALTLDQLSGGRMLLGLGLSGPQVVEGWHGVGYAKPLTRTREYIEIVRRIFARQEPLTFEGEFYQLPYTGLGSWGLGKPLKSILHGRADLPIYLAAIGQQNVQLAAELADGWLPIFFAPQFYNKTMAQAVEAGRARGHHKNLEGFDIAPSVIVVLGDDLAHCWRQVKPTLALYVGGMGRCIRRGGRIIGTSLCTWVGWGPRAKIFTSIWHAAMVLKRRPIPYRNTICAEIGLARLWRYRMPWWMLSPCVAPAPVSLTVCRAGRKYRLQP